MIKREAIREFLKRPRDDWRPYKALTQGQLEKLCDELPRDPPIWSRLYKHQKACLLLGATNRRFMYHADMGMGKTLISIALVRYFLRLGLLKRKVLVLVPNKINKTEWEREISKHSPLTKCLVLSGSSVDKWQALTTTDALVVVESYPGLSRMVGSLVPGKRGKRKLKPEPKLVAKLVRHFDGLIMDEINATKNHLALPYRLCRQVSKQAEFVFGLTGTPFGRDPIDLWAQMYLIDLGYTLGETLGLYRAAFFSEAANEWGGNDYTFRTNMQTKLNRVLAHATIRYEADASDMPAVVPVLKTVSLPDDAHTYSEQMRGMFNAAKGNFRETKNAFLRMRQISSGFVGYVDEDTGKKAQYVFSENPKLEMLTAILEVIHSQAKAVVFHEFILSGDMIETELKRLKISYVRLSSRTTDHPEVLRRFDEDDKVRVFILNNSCVYGLNLQVAQYSIFYESPVSVITRKQAVRRVKRQGSLHKTVFEYDLITRNTFDQRILQFHAQGEDLFQAIIEGRIKTDDLFSRLDA